jgi:hypothetical protein
LNSGDILNGIGAWANEEAIPISDPPVASLLPSDNDKKPMLHVFLNEPPKAQSWSHVATILKS